MDCFLYFGVLFCLIPTLAYIVLKDFFICMDYNTSHSGTVVVVVFRISYVVLSTPNPCLNFVLIATSSIPLPSINSFVRAVALAS